MILIKFPTWEISSHRKLTGCHCETKAADMQSLVHILCNRGRQKQNHWHLKYSKPNWEHIIGNCGIGIGTKSMYFGNKWKKNWNHKPLKSKSVSWYYMQLKLWVGIVIIISCMLEQLEQTKNQKIWKTLELESEWESALSQPGLESESWEPDSCTTLNCIYLAIN